MCVCVCVCVFLFFFYIFLLNHSSNLLKLLKNPNPFNENFVVKPIMTRHGLKVPNFEQTEIILKLEIVDKILFMSVS